MDKRSDFFNASEHVEEEPELEEEEVVEVVEEKPKKRSYTKQSEPKTVKLRLMKQMKVNAIGKVTGKKYTWDRGGAIVDVDILDKDKLLEKLRASDILQKIHYCAECMGWVCLQCWNMDTKLCKKHSEASNK